MVDLYSQYLDLKPEIDKAIEEVISNSQFIKGPKFEAFQNDLSVYMGSKHTIGCANGTDALQIAMMALDLKPGDEVILPAFTYIATAEAIALLGLSPVLVDVDYDTFNIKIDDIHAAISPKTKVIIPVHLFGQSSNMEAIMAIAAEKNLFVIEDCAQSIGSNYTFSNGTIKMSGVIGHIGCTSFFPSKNLGCMGDGGAVFCQDDELAEKIKMIANHGQRKQYYHEIVGVNSRLDNLQAAILIEKLKQLDNYSNARRKVADKYDKELEGVSGLMLPYRVKESYHVFNQYTLKVKNGLRDDLKKHLGENGIPSMIYYPMPVFDQEAYKNSVRKVGDLKNSQILCTEVLSLPIHTHMKDEDQDYIISNVKSFFK